MIKMVTKVVFKIKPVAQPTPSISIEEYLEAQQTSLDLQKDIDTKIADATRTIEVVESLEELAVVADSITGATREEAHLIEIGGNIAVAGTNVDPAALIPSLESYIGGKISLEEFDFKEKIKKIWNAIKAMLKKIWEAINNFLEQSNILLAHSLNNITKTEALVKNNKGSKVKDDNFELDLNKFKLVFSSVASSATAVRIIQDRLTATEKIFKEFPESYTKKLVEAIQFVTGKLKILTDKNIKDISLEVMDGLKQRSPLVFDTVISTAMIASAAKSDADSKNGLEVLYGRTNLLGKSRLAITQPDVSDIGDDFKTYIERLRVSQIKLEMLVEEEVSRPLTTVLTQEELESLVNKTKTTLQNIKFYKDRGTEKKLKEAKEQLELVSNGLTTRFNDLTPEDASIIQSLMSLNIVFINWTKTPMIDLVQHAIRIERAVNWLVKANLRQYEKVSSKEGK